MAKKIKFDEKNNLNISDFSEQTIDGVKVQLGTFRSIDESQIEKHLTMIDADLNASEKTKVQSIIQSMKNVK